jgi:transcriptional regulator with XRE-family HTH domain
MFRKKLKELREKKGISQAALAKELNVWQSTIGNWESGTREPNFEMSQRIADFFGVTIDYLLGRTITQDKQTDITIDDFTYAMQNESRSLTEKDKALLLSMARQLGEARKAREGIDSSH